MLRLIKYICYNLYTKKTLHNTENNSVEKYFCVWQYLCC